MPPLLAKPDCFLWCHIHHCLDALKEFWSQNGEVISRRVESLGFDSSAFYGLLEKGVFLHDFGKATVPWQEYIRDSGNRISHALFSFMLALHTMRLDKRLPTREELALLLAVLAHHQQLHNNAFVGETLRATGRVQVFARDLNQIVASTPELGLSKIMFDDINTHEACRYVEKIQNMMRSKSAADLVEFKALYCLFLSIIRLTDNVGSARQRGEACQLPIPSISSITQGFSRTQAGQTPNELQHMVLENDSPYLIVQAGCGSGKTGAALHYAVKLLKEERVNRVIFTLPTRFTTNSMFWDFLNQYGIPLSGLGVYHSEAADLLIDLHPDDAVGEEIYQNAFFNKTVTVSTIDHLLYSLLHCHRYADRAFGSIVSSAVIFDEIHYYDSFTLKKIGQAMQLLRKLAVPHLVMTATMPEAVRQTITEQGQTQGIGYSSITAADDGVPFGIQKMRRPLIENGEVNNELLHRVKENAAYRQIIVVNQVEKAKTIAGELAQKLPDLKIICYHSQFTRSHRSKKERQIRDAFKGQYRGGVVLVTTQICELSLDISTDVMYSEIAPADSIVQRGGRLHRRGRTPLREDCGCKYCRTRGYLPESFQYTLYLFPVNWDDSYDLLPYRSARRNILRESWEIITGEYNFTSCRSWVDQLYPERPELNDLPMMDMIVQDAVFGRTPRERYGCETSEQSKGAFRVRQPQYDTVSVVPKALFKEQMIDDPMLFKESSVIVSRTRAYQTGRIIGHVSGVKVLDVPYYFEYGFKF